MKNLRSLFLFTFCLTCSVGFSQETSGTSLKLYSNFGWLLEETNFGEITVEGEPAKHEDFDLGYFTPAVVFTGAYGNTHEIEFSRFQMNRTEEVVANPQTIAIERNTEIFVALRYEFSFLFFKGNKDRRLKPALGFAGRPYYSSWKNVPAFSTAFTKAQSNLGVMLSIIPRVTYNLNDRWFLDLNVPFNFTDLRVSTRRNINPALPANQQSVTTIESHFLPTEYLIRFGVGVRL